MALPNCLLAGGFTLVFLDSESRCTYRLKTSLFCFVLGFWFIEARPGDLIVAVADSSVVSKTFTEAAGLRPSSGTE